MKGANIFALYQDWTRSYS
uniref:Uncharacterized protein n=1 Tax=Anguilla anguilla TaxID=7936 RepID=A0A0E9U8N9_ANGAN